MLPLISTDALLLLQPFRYAAAIFFSRRCFRLMTLSPSTSAAAIFTPRHFRHTIFTLSRFSFFSLLFMRHAFFSFFFFHATIARSARESERRGARRYTRAMSMPPYTFATDIYALIIRHARRSCLAMRRVYTSLRCRLTLLRAAAAA